MKVNVPIVHGEHAWYGCLTWRIPGVIVQEEKTTTIRPDGLILAIVHVRIKQIHQTLPFCKHSLVGKLGKHSYLLLHMPESDLIQSGKERGIKNITMHTCHWSHNVFFSSYILPGTWHHSFSTQTEECWCLEDMIAMNYNLGVFRLPSLTGRCLIL